MFVSPQAANNFHCWTILYLHVLHWPSLLVVDACCRVGKIYHMPSNSSKIRSIANQSDENAWCSINNVNKRYGSFQSDGLQCKEAPLVEMYNASIYTCFSQFLTFIFNDDILISSALYPCNLPHRNIWVSRQQCAK